MDDAATITDLKERLQAAEAALRDEAGLRAELRRSEDLRRIAFEGGRMGTWRSNLREEVISGDATFMSLWGFAPTDTPRPYSEFLDRMSPEGRDRMAEMVASTHVAGMVFDGEHAVAGGPTKGLWVRWRGLAEREQPWIVNGVCFDVTDQRRRDERLRESETRHRLLIESWAQAVWETDADGAVTAGSPSWRGYTGQTLEAWLGYGWLDAIHPGDRAHAEQEWREALAARRVVDAEFRLRSPDGAWRWTNVRAAPVFDAHGRIEKWAGMNIDIDDRKRAETALRESEQRLRTLFDSIDEGYAELDVILDQSGQVIDWRYVTLNAAFTRVTGMAEKDVMGRLISEIIPNLEPAWGEIYTRVIKTGEPVRFEQAAAAVGQWYEVYASRSGGSDSRRIVVVYNEITARKRAEITLRESEARQAYLVKLSDTLRPLVDARKIKAAAATVVGEWLNVASAGYAETEPGGLAANITDEYNDGRIPSLKARYVLKHFGSIVDAMRRGELTSFADLSDPHVDPVARASFSAINVRSAGVIPLIKGGVMVGYLFFAHPDPRVWTSAELEILRETAERTWAAVEQARAEAALRESEELFRQFAASSADVLWVRRADTGQMEFVSPAFAQVYGSDPRVVLDGIETWAALIVPEDRQAALEHIERAVAGTSITHEFRIQRPSDGAFRWIRNQDFPVRDEAGRVRRIGGIATDITDAKLATEHQAVLLAELQHRVRNIMALARSITARTAESATDVEDYAARMSGRLLTLARVQALLTRAANVGVSITTIVHDELAAAAGPDRHREIQGPDLVLSPKAAEVLTLAVHELATNAVKYGGLSVPHGVVRVSWRTFERRDKPWLHLDWVEEGAPPTDPAKPRRVGFGSELIEARVPYELGGRGKVEIKAGGAVAELEFPLRSGDSILETDAPRAATVFGGALDMSGEADLTGHKVLVVEDDYYLASDTARALRGAGAEVIGPCPNTEAALERLEDETPTIGVVDINLGGGPSFEVAQALRKSAIPLVFVTGYDPEVIPAEFSDVLRLQKPIELREIIRMIAATAGPVAEGAVNV